MIVLTQADWRGEGHPRHSWDDATQLTSADGDDQLKMMIS